VHRRPPLVRFLLVAAACSALLPALSPAGPARSTGPAAPQQTFDVATEAQFNAALALAQPGDTIRLADGNWPALEVTNRSFSGTVTITGFPSRGATLGGTFTVVGSRNITLTRVTVDGGGVFFDADTTDVAVTDSELTNCAGMCVQMGRKDIPGPDDQFTTRVTISGNAFHDSSDHFVGQVGNDIRIERNTFDRVKRAGCGAKNCPELVRIRGGGPWTLVRNRFGEAEQKGPQVRVWPGFRPAIHDVMIASNIFDSLTVPGQAGVDIEGSAIGRDEARPLRVSVVNNTIFVDTNSVGLADSWEREVPGRPPPIVANNIFRNSGAKHCNRGRFFSNLAQRMRGSCSGIVPGDAKLDAEFRPTSDSLLVIDKADPAYAPATDYFGLPRIGPPDRGAIEYRG
jgi:hypothetical protein